MVFTKQQRKEYYLKNKEKKNEYSRKYFQANKDKLTELKKLKNYEVKKQIPERVDIMINNFIKNKDYGEVVLFVPENTHKNNLAFYKAEVLK